MMDALSCGEVERIRGHIPAMSQPSGIISLQFSSGRSRHQLTLSTRISLSYEVGHDLVRNALRDADVHSRPKEVRALVRKKLVLVVNNGIASDAWIELDPRLDFVPANGVYLISEVRCDIVIRENTGDMLAVVRM